MRDPGARFRVTSTTVAVLLGAACGPATAPRREAAPAPALNPDLDWYGDNRAQLDAMIRSLGSQSPAYDPEHPPVAVFDCDNTLIHSDIADATLYWFLDHDLLRQPPGGDWGETSAHMTAEAQTALARACGTHPDGAPLPTSSTPACTDEILSIYDDGTTVRGAQAWVETGYDHRAHVPSYAWLAQLQAGYTPEEVRAFTRKALDAALAAAVGTTRTIGTRGDLEDYIRIPEQMKDLVAVLEANGFAVWVVSASPEPNVQAVAERFGIPTERVIGIRVSKDANGRLTRDLARCGRGAPDAGPVIAFMDGKRCWIDQEIFAGQGRLEQHPDPSHRPHFVAGDATTDVSMLLDATALRLVLNRNKPELMCHAYHGTAGSWLVNPRFVAPKPRRAEPYPCSTTACRSRDGASVPCRDLDGTVIPDQEDRVHSGD